MAYNDAAYRATIKYRQKNIKRVGLDMQIKEFEKLKEAADQKGEKVNEYIKKAIKLRMESE